MKKFAGERARLVANEQVIHAAARSRVPDEAAAQDLRAKGVDLSGRDLANFGEADAVFVPEGQIAEKIFKRPQSALREDFRAARSYAFEVHQLGCGRHGHFLFISRTSSTGFSLWGLVLARTKPHRLKPVLLAQSAEWLAIPCGMGKDGLFVPAPREACLPLERLDGNDAKVLLIWILAGILGAGVAYTYFFRAFPEASVEFKVPRADALAVAKQFAAAQGAQLGGYDSSIVFDVDDTAKTYLEREVGLQQANQMMASEVHIWYWQTRFFRPLQKEEFDVRVDPAGGIVGYAHALEEAAPGARLERAAAQATAESFLRDTLHADLSRYDFREEEANLTERPARRDWSFSWERRGFRAKDAPYRLTVTLAGDRVSGYNEFLKVPEAWSRDYERLRSSNNLLEFIALIPYAFLIGGCLYVIVSLGRRGLLEWRTGLALGIFLTVLFFLMTMNQWPLDRAGYDTNTPYSSFFLSQVGQAALISVVSALLVVLAVVPGEPLYRIFQPDKIRLDVGFRLPGIRTKEFFRANVIGICLAAAHIGYITVFYIISRKAGRVGAARPQLRKRGQHLRALGLPADDRHLRRDERGISLPPVRDSVFAAHHEVAIPGRRPARLLLGISAQQLSAGARVHSRHRSRPDRHRRGTRHAALGNLGDAHLALHGGRVSHQHFLAALARRVSARLRSDRGRRRADSAGHRRHFLYFARRIRSRRVALEQRPAHRRAADGRGADRAGESSAS